MSILLLGSTGLLGQAIATELKYRGLPFAGIARQQADYCLDVTDTSALITQLEVVRPDIIINTIAQVDLAACEANPGHSYRVNAAVSAYLARYCARHNGYYIYISTDHYYTGDGNLAHTEQHPVNLCNEYAMSKYCGEQFALTYRRSLVVRTNIVGFRQWPQRPSFVEWVIQTLKQQQPMVLFEDVYTSSLDVRTAAKALLDLIATGATGVFNLASAEVASKQQFIEALAAPLALSTQCAQRGSYRQQPGPVMRNESLGLDVRRAEAQLGYSLPRLAAVIQSLTAEYYAIKDKEVKKL